MAVEDDLAEWQRTSRRSGRKTSAGATAGGTSPPEVEVPEGIALVGQDREAAEVLFRQLGRGYIEKLEAMRLGGALGSDALRAMHENAETEVKLQCARAGARISDILKVVTGYMSRVHDTVMGAAEQQRELFGSAVDSLVDDSVNRLDTCFGEIAKRGIQKRMEQAERGMDGSTFYQAALQAGTADAAQGETDFWHERIREAEEGAKRDAAQVNEALREQLHEQTLHTEQLEAKIEHLVDAQDKKNAAGMRAYDLLVEELSRSEAQSVREFQLKAEEKKKVRRLEMAKASLQAEVDQLSQTGQVLEQALSSTSDRLQAVQQRGGLHWKVLEFTRKLLDAEVLEKSLRYQQQHEQEQEHGRREQEHGEQANSPGLDAFLSLSTANKVACLLQRNYRRRRHKKEQELMVKVCLRLQRWTRGNIVRKKLAAQAAADIAERVAKRNAMLARYRKLLTGDPLVDQAPLLGIVRAAAKARRRLQGLNSQNEEVVHDSEASAESDVVASATRTDSDTHVHDVVPESQPKEDHYQPEPLDKCNDQLAEDHDLRPHMRTDMAANEVVREVVVPSYPSSRPRGGVEEALWWKEAAQAIRELQEQVRQDDKKRETRGASLSALQQHLRVSHQHGRVQSTKLAEMAEQIADLTKQMAQHKLGGRDAAGENLRSTLQQSLREARKGQQIAIEDTKAQQESVTAFAAVHAIETQREAQRLQWLRQLSSQIIDYDYDELHSAGRHIGGETDATASGGGIDQMSAGSTVDGNRRQQFVPPASGTTCYQVVATRSERKDARARSIRFAPLEMCTERDAVARILRAGAEIRSYPVETTESDVTIACSDADECKTKAPAVQVDIRNLRGLGTVQGDGDDSFAGDKHGGILKGSRSPWQDTPRPRPASAGSRGAFINAMTEVTLAPRPRSADPGAPRTLRLTRANADGQPADTQRTNRRPQSARASVTGTNVSVYANDAGRKQRPTRTKSLATPGFNFCGRKKRTMSARSATMAPTAMCGTGMDNAGGALISAIPLRPHPPSS